MLWREERLWEVTNGSEVPDVIKLVIKFLRARFSHMPRTQQFLPRTSAQHFRKLWPLHLSKCLSQSPALQKTWLFKQSLFQSNPLEIISIYLFRKKELTGPPPSLHLPCRLHNATVQRANANTPRGFRALTQAPRIFRDQLLPQPGAAPHSPPALAEHGWTRRRPSPL